MVSTLIQSSIISSKTAQTNLQNFPRLKSLQYEIVADSQNLESFLSDTLHSVGFSAGNLPTPKKSTGMKLANVAVTKTVSGSRILASGLANFKVEDAKIAFHGADQANHVFVMDISKKFLESKIENDLKYRLGIQEYYLENVALKLTAKFDSKSVGQVRARELRLRLNHLPLRILHRAI